MMRAFLSRLRVRLDHWRRARAAASARQRLRVHHELYLLTARKSGRPLGVFDSPRLMAHARTEYGERTGAMPRVTTLQLNTLRDVPTRETSP